MKDQEHTFSLVARACKGDAEAENQLAERYWKVLQGWAHGRLPLNARERADTDDLVQMTLLKTLQKLRTFEPRREGAFTAYLHQILMNQIRDEIRRASRRPRQTEVPDTLPAGCKSPDDEVIQQEFVERYEAALARLPEQQRKAVLLRLELGHSHQEVADALGSPSPDAARMLLSRGLARLAELMQDGG
jgi:RNA polymerase sigma-70 factor (ECF subfamily)